MSATIKLVVGGAGTVTPPAQPEVPSVPPSPEPEKEK